MTDVQRRWLSVVISLIAIAFGIAALGKPYWSLESVPELLVLVTLMVFLWRGAMHHRATIAVIVAIIAVGLVFRRDLAVMLFVYGAIAYLLYCGTVGLLTIRKRDWFTAIAGVSGILIGMMAAYWLDLTSILIGLAVGPALIGVGFFALWRAWKNEGRLRLSTPGTRTLVQVGSVALLLTTMVSLWATGFAINNAPAVDEFADYDHPLGSVPGVLLKAEPFQAQVPDAMLATRILYTTTGMDGGIALATGLVVVPANRSTEPIPVVLWAHGTTGVHVTCAPTLLNDPLSTDSRLIPTEIIDQGWAIVSPDYLGLGVSDPHPYLVGIPAAHSSLDAVRAARQLEDTLLSDQTIVWGHSQGGGTALWIGMEATSYAPDVPLLGVAALAPASDLPGFLGSAVTTAAGPIFGSYIILAYSQAYDDVYLHDYIRPGARFSQDKLVQRCLSEPSMLVSLISALIREPFLVDDWHDGKLVTRLGENVPSSSLGVPVYIGQGAEDPLILESVQSGYVQTMCESGEHIEYHIYEGEDHMSVMEEDSDAINDMIVWTHARLSGDPPANPCSSN